MAATRGGGKAQAGGSARLWNLPRGWAHQGFFYLDGTERMGRVFFEIVPTALLAGLLGRGAGIPLASVRLWGGSLLAVHTLNWLFNGNWWAGMLFAIPQLRNRGERVTCAYLRRMADRLGRQEAISGVMIYGSVSRGQWHSRSDLDVRLLRHRGVVNGIAGVLILLRERWIAFWARQPLDIYLADDLPFLRKMRPDEPPIFLKKEDPLLDLAYPDGRETRVEGLRMNRQDAAPSGEGE